MRGHTGKGNQAIANPPMELDSIPCYYTVRHKGESGYVNTRWLQRYKCSDEHWALPSASVWERKPFKVVLVKRKRSDSSTCMGMSAFLAFLAVFCEEKKRYFTHFLDMFLIFLWVSCEWNRVGSPALALIEARTQSAVGKWCSQLNESRGSRDIPSIFLYELHKIRIVIIGPVWMDGIAFRFKMKGWKGKKKKVKSWPKSLLHLYLHCYCIIHMHCLSFDSTDVPPSIRKTGCSHVASWTFFLWINLL